MKPLTYLAASVCVLYLLGGAVSKPDSTNNPGDISAFQSLPGISAGRTRVEGIHVKATKKTLGIIPANVAGNCADVYANGWIVWTSDFSDTPPRIDSGVLYIPMPRPTEVVLETPKTSGCSSLFKSDQPVNEALKQVYKDLCDKAKADDSHKGDRLTDVTEAVNDIRPSTPVSFVESKQTSIKGCGETQ